jgi:hypothetical protein
MMKWYEPGEYPRWLERILDMIVEHLDKNPEYCRAELVMWSLGWRPLLWILPWSAHHGVLKIKTCNEENGYYCGKCDPTFSELANKRREEEEIRHEAGRAS